VAECLWLCILRPPMPYMTAKMHPGARWHAARLALQKLSNAGWRSTLIPLTCANHPACHRAPLCILAVMYDSMATAHPARHDLHSQGSAAGQWHAPAWHLTGQAQGRQQLTNSLWSSRLCLQEQLTCGHHLQGHTSDLAGGTRQWRPASPCCLPDHHHRQGDCTCH
jgi:hypothetical protein